MSYLFGRDCKLGYGIDKELNYIVPFECTPHNVTEAKDDSRWLNVYCLYDQNIFKWGELGLLLSDTYLKYLEHQIVFDQNEHYLIKINVSTKYEECERCDKYPDNVPRYVSRIDYGMELWVVVNQNELPNNRGEVDKCLNNVLDKKSTVSGITKLSNRQQQLKCRVLINFSETREMSLGQVFKFVDEFQKGHIQQYECPLGAGSKEIDGNVSIIENPDGYCYFFEMVYRAHRKMELILEKSGCPQVPEMPCKQDTFPAICELVKESTAELKLLINEFNSCGDEMLIPKIYPVMKQLIQLNKLFVKNAIENRIDIESECYFAYNALQPLFKTLNTWKPASYSSTCDKLKKFNE